MRGSIASPAGYARLAAERGGRGRSPGRMPRPRRAERGRFDGAARRRAARSSRAQFGKDLALASVLGSSGLLALGKVVGSIESRHGAGSFLG